MTTTPPPAKPPQTSLHGPSIATIYQDYFKGDPAENRAPGESSTAELQEVKDGKNAFPSVCHAIFDVEPMPTGCEQLYWPTWTFKFYDYETGELKITDVLRNESPEGQVVRIVGPETPDSVWTKSSGFRLIGNFTGCPFKARMEVTAQVGAFVSDDVLQIPWVGAA